MGVLFVNTPCLQTFVCLFVCVRCWQTSQHRLTIQRGADNSDIYGKLNDDGALAKVEHICDWLMDEHKCPTTWATLLAIRRENGLDTRA